jgi:hypothetical protein
MAGRSKSAAGVHQSYAAAIRSPRTSSGVLTLMDAEFCHIDLRYFREVNMRVETAITRALSGVGRSTKYESPGRMPSFDATAWPSGSKCDCSGFIDWVFRLFPTRKVDHPLYRKINGGWFETSGIHADGLANTGWFSRIDDPRPGALLVCPDYVGADGRKHDGHIGLVVDVSGSGITGASKVVHCSFGNWKNKGDAIQVTDASVWAARLESIVVWLDNLLDV